MTTGEDVRIDAVRIVTEQGMNADMVDRLSPRIERALEGEGITLQRIVVSSSSLEVTPMRDLVADPETAPDDRRTSASDDDIAPNEAVILLTELPRGYRKRSLMIEIDHRRRMAIISAPSLGPLLGPGLMRCIVAAVRRLHDAEDCGRVPFATGWISEDDGRYDYLLSRRRLSRIRMVLGMVRSNRPWRLIPTLTGLTAAAAATASFGIFYSSIWQMAAALSVGRLALITGLSVTLASVWLIINNRLWQPAGGIDAWRRGLYNAATVCTVVFNAVILYALLFVATGTAAAIVIDTGFMSEQLGEPANIGSYAKLAWLATSMGMVAGGLGSSVDSRDDVLRATYGYRERLRRQRAEDVGEREA